MGFPFPLAIPWESHGNPTGMGIDDTIGNGNGQEWESPYVGMGMTLIPMGINSRMRCLAYVIVTYSLLYNGNGL